MTNMDVKKSSGLVVAVMITVMLIAGTSNTVASKFQNDTCAMTRDGRNIKFTHPWVQTLFMFLGEFSCLGMLFIKRRYFPEGDDTQSEGRGLSSPKEDGRLGEYSPLINGSPAKAKSQPIFSFIFAVPACLDLFGTTIAAVALLFIPSSVWQLLRGSLIVFVGILSVIFLKRRLKPYNWAGMGIVIAGLTLVGTSVLIKPSKQTSGQANESSSGEMVLGVILVLVGQLISAVQFIVEETMLSKRNCEPLQVVGMEGAFGLMFTLVVLVPWYYVPENPVLPECGDVNATVGKPTISSVFHDNSLDAFYQMQNPMIAWSLLIYTFGIAFYNFTGLMLTKKLSAVHRTLIDACRSLSVWLVNLFTYYAISEDYGEEWTTWSFAELGGFALLVLGTLMYNAIIRFPCFDYSDSKSQAPIVAAEGDNLSPMIAGSPRFTFKADKKQRKSRKL